MKTYPKMIIFRVIAVSIQRIHFVNDLNFGLFARETIQDYLMSIATRKNNKLPSKLGYLVASLEQYLANMYAVESNST